MSLNELIKSGMPKRLATVVNTVGAGSAQPGASIVRAFPFAFDTPNILTGAVMYTPTVGDILLDAWIEIDTAWDGTTPWAGGSVSGYVDAIDHSGNLRLFNGDLSTIPSSLLQGIAGSAYRQKLTSDPITLWITQDGTSTGADPGSTQGAAILYLVTATPV